MENLTGMAALIRDIWNEREDVDESQPAGIEMLIYWHSAFEAVQQAIESTIDYFQFGLGCPEGFAFDWYAASVELNSFSADTAAILSSDDALALSFAITQLTPLELSEFVYELQVWYEELNQLCRDARASFERSELSGSNHKRIVA